MKIGARKWLAIAMLFGVFTLGAWSFASLPNGTVAEAAAPPGQVDVRRESQPPSTGPQPRTGPASALMPLERTLGGPIFGENYRANTDTQQPNRAQQEPSIAVNPTNPLNVVAAAKDERAGTNTKQVWIYTSTDGGVTWLNQIFPFAPAASPYSSDPVVNFSDDGICYVTSLPYGGGPADGIQVARSTDGGITFSPGVHLPGTSNNSDKEWTWIDNFPTSPYYHRLYTAWMDFGSGSVWRVNYSSDRGQTWSQPSAAYSAFQFPMPVVVPNGNVLVTYLSGSALTYRRSTNGGVGFGTAQSISPVTTPRCPPDNSGCSIWRLNAIPATGVNPTNGSIVSTWADGRTNAAVIYYVRSTNAGATWSTAAQLAPPGAANVYQVQPWVEADETGTFHAIWYDDRENPNTSIFHIYYSRSTDDGATWSPALRISTAPSDLRIGIPSSYNRSAGDYIQVTASHGNIYAAWTDTRSGTGEDIYVVRGTLNMTSTPTVTVEPATPTATATAQASSTAVPPTATTTVSAGTPSATAMATATACAIEFNDVPPGSTFYAFVRCLACRGIVGGYNDGTFRPNNPVTRGQIAKIVSASAGFSEPAGEPIYEDVEMGSTFYTWINRLSRRGVMGGYPCGGPNEPCIPPMNRPYFRPTNNATRGQLSKIVSEAAGFSDPPGGQTFEDVPLDNTFYVWIVRLVSRGVMGGYPCGGAGEPCGPENRPYFRPNNSVTRGQASKIVANTFFPECSLR